MIRLMARKNHSEEFRRQAVDLFESTPGAALKGIAANARLSKAVWRGPTKRPAAAETFPLGPSLQ